MREIDHTPIMDRFNLMSFTDELMDDLKKLRAGEISSHEAHARANLAKQVLKAVNYTIIAQKFLIENAQQVPQLGEEAKPMQEETVTTLPKGRKLFTALVASTLSKLINGFVYGCGAIAAWRLFHG